MEDFKTEKWTLDDGRRAERRVTEQNCEDGQIERVVELHVEDERPLKLQQRVVEKSKPIVYERKIEKIDPITGSVIDQKIESIEPKVQMQLVKHVQSSYDNVNAQSFQEDHVTKKEMIDTIVTAIKAAFEIAKPEPVKEMVRETPFQAVRAQSMPVATNGFADRLNSLGLADEISGRVNANSSFGPLSLKDTILLIIVAAQVIGLGYIVFFM